MNAKSHEKKCDCLGCKIGVVADQLMKEKARFDATGLTFIITAEQWAGITALRLRDEKNAKDAQSQAAQAVLANMTGGKPPEDRSQHILDTLKGIVADTAKLAGECERTLRENAVEAERRRKRYYDMKRDGEFIVARINRMNEDAHLLAQEQKDEFDHWNRSIPKAVAKLNDMGVWEEAMLDWVEREFRGLSDAMKVIGY